jgi:hypothetical protein
MAAKKLPYEGATSGDRALSDIQKLLRAFGCTKFGSMSDEAEGSILVQFEYRGRPVSCKASIKGYAAAWLKAHPFGNNRRCTRADYEKRAMGVASTAVYSILRDWIKGQITAIETGVLSFDGAFLGQILLPSGRTILEHVAENMLPAIEGPKS